MPACFQNLTSGDDYPFEPPLQCPHDKELPWQPAEMAREFYQEHPKHWPRTPPFCRFGHQTTDARDPWLPKAVAPGHAPLWKPLVEVPQPNVLG